MIKSRVFVIPYAGGAAATFKHWRGMLDNSVDLHVIELAGHGNNMAVPFYNDMKEAIEDVYNIIKEKQKDDLPYYILGHCLGAIIAFEVCHTVRGEREFKMPEHVFISGHGSPDIIINQDPIHDLDDENIVKKLIERGGLDEEMLDEELLELYLPSIRSDAKIYELYQCEMNREPLNQKLTILYGLKDKDTPIENVEKWKEFTNKEVNIKSFDGGHYFINDSCEEVISELNKVIRKNSRKKRVYLGL
ncbi:thioesterase II family protein [Wukongibacter sp. M2B1]|uniref:thioesterase II family protein n=1 Tax=Wukongibacter sp. M2B1 TaxID=3088895 RepID=UPI003D79CA32|nr:thioesterase [Wukongibacter baidiensis]